MILGRLADTIADAYAVKFGEKQKILEANNIRDD